MSTVSSAPPLAPRPRAARWAVTAYFLVPGIVFGSWVARIPAVKRSLGLSDGELGIALLGIAAGALLAMPATGWLIARWGSRRITIIAGVAICGALVLPPWATGLLPLMLTLALLGAANGTLDIAMNAQAVAVERRYRRPIMSTIHGAFSIGGLTGAGTAGLVATWGIGVRPHLLGVAVVMLLVVVVAAPRLLPARDAGGTGGPAFARPSRALTGLGAIAFCSLLIEGAMADWSAVYLRETLETSAGLAAAGFAAFSLTMAGGRFTGDRLNARFGPVAIIRGGGALVVLGLGLGLVIATPIAGLIGFALVGAGLAATFPVVLSAAGRAAGASAGATIAAVATVGYTGFLAGPPVIGLVAEVTGLRAGLGVVVLLGAAMVGLAGAVAAPALDKAPEEQRIAVPVGD